MRPRGLQHGVLAFGTDEIQKARNGGGKMQRVETKYWKITKIVRKRQIPELHLMSKMKGKQLYGFKSRF